MTGKLLTRAVYFSVTADPERLILHAHVPLGLNVLFARLNVMLGILL